jgi:hypothetical protein
MTTSVNRNILELQEIREEVQDIETLKSKINDTIVQLNFILRSLTLSNLDGELKTVTVPANTTLRISHRLKLVPKYKIILNQSGGGLITDGAKTRNYIELTNSGGTDAIVTLIIVKD